MKKGSVIVPEWLVQLTMDVLEIMAVILIVAGIGYVIWQAQKTPQDQDFKRVLDATAKLLSDYDKGEIRAMKDIPVPVNSETPYDVAFYPDGVEKQCRGKPCLCMYYVTSSGASKTTCKVLGIQTKCTGTCGGKLCAGPVMPAHAVIKGNTIDIKIACTTEGSQFLVT